MTSLHEEKLVDPGRVADYNRVYSVVLACCERWMETTVRLPAALTPVPRVTGILPEHADLLDKVIARNKARREGRF